MSATLVETPRRKRRRAATERDCLVEARGLRRALTAALRAGRTPMQIALAAGVRTASVKAILDGASFATLPLANRLSEVLDVWERVLVVDARGGHVPYAVLAPLVEEAVERHGVERTAFLSGIPSRRLHSLRSGETRLVTIGVADRIVTSLDSPARWHEEPLARWYYANTVHA